MLSKVTKCNNVQSSIYTFNYLLFSVTKSAADEFVYDWKVNNM